MENGGYEIIRSLSADNGTKVEIIAYTKLKGCSDVKNAQNLYFAQQTGMSAKMIKITLDNSSVRVEPGTLYYMKGDLKMKSSTGGGLVRGLKRKVLTKESFFVNEIEGSGEIYLEPTFGHFFMHRIDGSENGIIVDKGLFYAGTRGLDITSHMQRSISASVMGSEGLFQTRIQGQGIAVIYSPVPQEEIQRFNLNDERLYVDGDFALMRSVKVKYKVQRSGKSWISTGLSKEGFLQTFEGTGHVWIAPTQGIYDKLEQDINFKYLSRVQAARHTETSPE